MHDGELQFATESWRAVFASDGIRDFDSLWNLDGTAAEPANERRGGWSGVTIIELGDPQAPQRFFLKRQLNHGTRNWRHPLRGEPTFAREWRNIRRLLQLGVPTVEPVVFAKRRGPDGTRAMLVTAALEGYRPLDEFLAETAVFNMPRAGAGALSRRIAQAVAPMHRARMRHGSLYPKHLFVRATDAAMRDFDVRLIDLEKARSTLTIMSAALRDISQLDRHSPAMPLKRRLRFLRDYWNALGIGGSPFRLRERLVERASR
ncbi:MAG: hypothetical protein KDG50_01225 [Chromatiales bacterium]|nr:hypothetical protein [Chromatiales bacterium]